MKIIGGKEWVDRDLIRNCPKGETHRWKLQGVNFLNYLFCIHISSYLSFWVKLTESTIPIPIPHSTQLPIYLIYS